ncbi:hypothetical protein GGX14DRAFT_624918 [Mycena pura]|uniref:CFEM domain-containing protein n=1 Tax=Mycena pura TaxID=153505 RepID=A0AAD6VGK8_9AGAR|nr:hypothetical protein GGX14DRAFT_624918 [Mycena pura]
MACVTALAGEMTAPDMAESDQGAQGGERLRKTSRPWEIKALAGGTCVLEDGLERCAWPHGRLSFFRLRLVFASAWAAQPSPLPPRPPCVPASCAPHAEPSLIGSAALARAQSGGRTLAVRYKNPSYHFSRFPTLVSAPTRVPKSPLLFTPPFTPTAMRFAVALLAFAAAALAQSSASDAAASSAPAATSNAKSAAPSKSGSASGAPAPSASAGLSALTPCVTVCLTAAAKNSTCGTFTNFPCVCTDANFQQKAATCLAAECQQSEATAALGLQQSQCLAQSISPSGSASATAPFLPSNSAADISASASAGAGPSASVSGNASSASGSASAPAGGAVALGSGSLGVACAVALVGALLGAVAVL